MKKQRVFRHILVYSIILAVLIAAAPAFADEGAGLDPDTRFYKPRVNRDAKIQIRQLKASGDRANARLIKKMIMTPHAVWFESGTPAEVQQKVVKTVNRAARQKNSVPVMVLYNLPFRDCAQFSAGGATTVQEYKDWIDGFAAGLGDSTVVVIVEPDGLGIIPFYKQFRGTDAEAADYEWCQPDEADEATAADERFEMLNYAAEVLKAKPNVKVYLDGTHSSWLGSGDAAHRLIQAGVERADGFYVNVSNYRLTEHLVKYGQWITDCIYLSQNSWWQVQWCASQYYPADPNDFSTWHLTDAAYDQAFADTGLTRDPNMQSHFVIDMSRNGQGPWTPTASYPDPQDWCNPPDRGLGLKPTADTGNAFIDALLWVKTPGESDGECTRGLGPAGETVDPEWGIIDPAAGEWFPEMALDLVQLANPPLE